MKKGIYQTCLEVNEKALSDSLKFSLMAHREKDGYSQAAVAEYLQISNNSYGKYEQASNNTLPSIYILIKLSKLYNVTLEELYTGNKESNDERILRIFSNCPEDKKEKLCDAVQIILDLL